MAINKNLDKNIEVLGISNKTKDILIENNIITVKDLWVKTRKELKLLKLSDYEIHSIIVKLQLIGLDLNKKVY